jgi:RimJ/RimL family protein N-acetyltransferase
MTATSPVLSDGVVTLRAPDDRDLDAIDAGIHDADVVRWLGQPEGTAAEVLERNRLRAADGSPTFAICAGVDDCVGHIWLNRDPSDRAAGAIGYWLLPTIRGRGYATRAVRLLAEHSLRELGMRRLRLVTEPDNLPSQRVAERAGFHRGETRQAHGEIDGRSIDVIVFALPLEET